MACMGPISSVFRTTSLIVAFVILAYLFSLLAPIVPVQVFISTDCGLGCPLILAHDRAVPGGFTASYLYSVTRQLTGFGAYYNIDEGYVLPSGLQWNNGQLAGFGVFLFIILPLSVVAVTCFVTALLIGRKQRYAGKAAS